MSSGRYKLTIDLDAVAQNWATLNTLTPQAVCSAVVKADAYGLGAIEVSRRLMVEGCRVFCVSSLAEALELREGLGEAPEIYILSGIFPGEERVCVEHNLIPTLVSLEMLDRWTRERSSHARSALKIDSGMGRLGVSELELDALLLEPDRLKEAGVTMVMSHLACADEPTHPLNAQQIERFQRMREKLLAVDTSLSFSLANSAGCTLSAECHFDMVRCGVGLYGGRPGGLKQLELRAVLALNLSIIQLRHLGVGDTAGYGAEFVAERETCLAVVAGGYADGLFRSLGKNAFVYVSGERAPIVGRVSMDSILVDVTGLGLELLSPEAWPGIELLGAHQDIESLARAANTISYEYLTSLGQRFERQYVGSVLR